MIVRLHLLLRALRLPRVLDHVPIWEAAAHMKALLLLPAVALWWAVLCRLLIWLPLNVMAFHVLERLPTLLLFGA